MFRNRSRHRRKTSFNRLRYRTRQIFVHKFNHHFFLEYAIYKVYLIQNYHKQNLTPSFIIREFKNEFQAYCSLLTTKFNIANLDREIRCVENWYDNYYVIKAGGKNDAV